mmetsp:Transcript_32900/g.115548  ORF Transcript_32900/g.115548 Transcript_32900/m.115548 type:complete len:372 (+) Transcript_32900:739-1854(+)
MYEEALAHGAQQRDVGDVLEVRPIVLLTLVRRVRRPAHVKVVVERPVLQESAYFARRVVRVAVLRLQGGQSHAAVLLHKELEQLQLVRRGALVVAQLGGMVDAVRAHARPAPELDEVPAEQGPGAAVVDQLLARVRRGIEHRLRRRGGGVVRHRNVALCDGGVAVELRQERRVDAVLDARVAPRLERGDAQVDRALKVREELRGGAVRDARGPHRHVVQLDAVLDNHEDAAVDLDAVDGLAVVDVRVPVAIGESEGDDGRVERDAGLGASLDVVFANDPRHLQVVAPLAELVLELRDDQRRRHAAREHQQDPQHPEVRRPARPARREEPRLVDLLIDLGVLGLEVAVAVVAPLPARRSRRRAVFTARGRRV